MTRFLALCSATLCSILSVALFVGSSASAQTSPSVPLLTTTKIWHSERRGQPQDHTKDFYGWLRDKIPEQANYTTKSRQEFITSYNQALEHGTWGVIQSEYKSSQYGDYGTYTLFWTHKKHDHCKFELYRTAGSYLLKPTHANPASQECRFNYASYNPDYRYGIFGTNQPATMTISMNNGAQKHSLVFFNGEYDVAPGLEDLPLLPRTPTERRQPDFMWTTSADGTFRATYMKNVEELKGNERFCSWRYTVQRKNHNYTENIGDTFNSDRVNLYAFAHKLEEHGNYEIAVRIDCNFHPPALPKDLSWIKPVTFRFKFDGNLLFGTTFDGNCADGVCKPTPQTCADIKDALPRISCNMREMFGTGVLNGSLVAAQDLAKAFFVSSPPSCGLPLASTGNRMLDTVNPGKMVSVACEKTKTFYHAFPIATVVVNFLAASLLLWMIVRMFNNLTDHRKDNMIGGL